MYIVVVVHERSDWMPHDTAREMLSLSDRFKVAIGLKGYESTYRTDSMQGLMPMNTTYNRNSGTLPRQTTTFARDYRFSADDSALPHSTAASPDSRAKSPDSTRARGRRPSLGAMPAGTSSLSRTRRFSTVDDTGGASTGPNGVRDRLQWQQAGYVQMVEPSKLLFREFPMFAHLLRQHQHESFLRLISVFQAKLMPVIEHRQGTSTDSVLPAAEGMVHSLYYVLCIDIRLMVKCPIRFIYGSTSDRLGMVSRSILFLLPHAAQAGSGPHTVILPPSRGLVGAQRVRRHRS